LNAGDFVTATESFTAAALAFAQAMGWPVPEFVYVILGACGFATVRAAIGKPAA
jgi:hypothetical protein